MSKFAPAIAAQMGAVDRKLKKSTVALGAVATGAGAAGAALFSIGSDFDDAADKIRIGTGKTGKALGRLNDDFKAVIKGVPATFDDASDAVSQLNQRLGITGKPLRRLSKQVLELSRITGTDLDTNIREVTRTFGDWGISLQDQPEALNKMFRASQKTGTAVQDLGRQLVRYGAPLRQLGFSFEEAAGLVGKFEQEGVNAQLVLGSLRIALGNLSDKGVKDAPKALALLTKEVKNAGTNLEATGIASKIFGKRAGPDMALAIREGRFNVAQLFDTIENGRDSIQKASKDTQDFNETWLKFKNNVMVALEPLAKRVFGGISKEAAALTKILTDPKLSGDEKFSAILDRISDGISKAVPKMADAAAKAAPKVARAFIDGFLNASVWGKLAIAGILISKFGGVAAWRAIGTKLGLGMGAGAAQGAAAGLVGGGATGGIAGAFAKLSPRFRAIGKGVLGVALVTGIGAAFSDKGSFGPTNVFQKFQQGVSTLTAGIVPGLRSLDERFATIAKRIGEFKGRLSMDEVTKDWGDFTEAQQRAIRGLVDVHNAAEKFKGKFGLQLDADTPLRDIRRLEKGFDRLRLHITGSLQDTLRQVNRNTNQIARSLGANTKQGVDAARKNFRLGMADIQDLVRSGVASASEGARAIRKVMVHYLGTFGIKGKTAKVLAGTYNAKDINRMLSGDTRLPDQRGGSQTAHSGFQRGGPIDLGAPIGDTVPAMLERGEYVLNRKAVKQVGRETLDRVNFKKAPRFASGGIVALGRRLQKEGYEVGEHPAFGGVAPVHTANSHHYRGEAIDVNDDSPPFASGGGEPGSLDRLYSRLKGMSGVVELLWRVANHFDHLHVAMQGNGKLGPGGLGMSMEAPKLPQLELAGPGGSVHVMAQRAVDTVRAGAQLKLNDAAAQAMPGVDLFDGSVPGGGGTSSKNQVLGRQMAARYGWTGAQWAALRELWDRESGWDANAVNPSSGAAGIPQALGHGHVFDLGDAGAQIAWGLKYIKDRYGTPSAALSFHDSHNWYKQGGQVGYVGDSLGVGTAGKLKGRIGDLVAKVAESRTSSQGLKILKGMLGKDYDRYIWDLGSNDPNAGSVKSNLQAADRATGDRLLLAATLNGTGAQSKNSALRALAGGDINLFEWAKRSKGLLENDGLHPTGKGYSQRAAMMAGALKAATSRHKGKGGDPKLPKLKGSLTHKARQTAKALSDNKDKKRRAKILKRFQKHLKKYGLPNKLLSEINFLSAAHDRFADFATEAAAGDVTLDDDSVVRGLINGKNEGGWLTEDLNAMFKARNKLVKARDIVTRNQKKVQSTLGFVNEQLKNLSKDGKTPAKWEGVNPAKDAVEKWNKQPAPKRHKRMKAWRDKHGKLPGTREFNTFTGKIKETPKSRIPALKTVKTKLGNQNTLLKGAISPENTDGSSILSQLEGLQGFGPPGVLKSPWPIGSIWGGDIRATQLRMLDLFKVPPKTTDDTTAGDDGRVELLAQLLREANLRTAVSERQFDVLRNFPPFGGQFATGGTVPGPAGAPRTVIAHGGETIVPEGKGGAAAPNVYVNFDGKVSFLRDFVDVRIEQQTRKATNRGRVLPGQAGGR